jgi:hypothetical protein
MASGENRKSGENPERNRRCMRLMSMLVDESQSLENREGRVCGAGGNSYKRESEDLLEISLTCRSEKPGLFIVCAEKRL